MANMIELIEKSEVTRDFPKFQIGDTLRIFFKIKEGDKERVQVFEGVLIGERGGSNKRAITVRKISFSHGVERMFPLASPRIEKIEIAQTGYVRRAKLYYLRDLRGKKARIRERKDYKKGKDLSTAQVNAVN